MAELKARPGAMRQRALLALMVASGFAGLGYQIVWTQQMALWLGHEAVAVAAVITAFFGGLGLGALTLGRVIERSAQPARWYAACEGLMAAWSLALALAAVPASDMLLRLIGAEPQPWWHATIAFVGCFLLLLPATAAMGATLPAMERVLARLALRGTSSGQGTSPIAALYASNTLGAMLGVLATAFWLLPAIGLLLTAALCVVLNLLCAGLALALAPAQPEAHPEPQPDSRMTAAARSATTADTPGRRTMLAVLATTGWLGVGYEVLVVRVLSQVSENTVYTFALLLATYLLGTTLGAAAYARWGPQALQHRRLLQHQPARSSAVRLLMLLAGSCALGAASLWAAPWLRDLAAGGAVDAANAANGANGSNGTDAVARGTMLWALLGEALPALLAFLLPTMVMGALFSHLATQARQAGLGLGPALGANTLGAAAAPPLFGLVLVPWLGPKGALLLVVLAYLLLAAALAWRSRLPVLWVGGAAAAVVAAALATPALVFVDVPEGGKLLSYREGTLAAVSVVADSQGVARLHINNRQQEGSNASLLADSRQALLPMLLHPAPQRALFLGLGTGVTASAAAADSTLAVDAAELLPEVIEASALFRSSASPAAPRQVAADARRFVKAPGVGYDLIISDNFHPARSGSALLYTVEHFQAVRQRLQPGGLFCQWLPLHQLDLNTLRSVVQSFLAVYPQGAAILATNSLQTPVLGLMARPDAPRFALGSVRQRLAQFAGPQPLAAFGLTDDFAVLGSLVAGPQALRQFAGDAPLNTDDRPVVAYTAPRITYLPTSAPADRLLALLAEFGAQPGMATELVDATAEPGWAPRLAAYWTARGAYLVAGRTVRPVADVRQMLAQVQAPLLAVLKTSPDFRPAREPLQQMASRLAQTDEAAAQALWQALAETHALPVPGAASTVDMRP